MTHSIRALLAGIVDYAGLFPPAKLPMDVAVANYAAYRESETSWMLGRFIVPVSGLDAFRDAATPHFRGETWRLSVVVGEDHRGDLERTAAFNASTDGAVIDAAEVRAGSPDVIAKIASLASPRVRVFVEVPAENDPRGLIKAIAAAKLRAKIRTGGTTPDAFPGVEQVVRFVRGCYSSSVPFKATAGLHHPVRAEYRLTYEDDSPSGVMHGFLNVFLLAAFCYNGLGAAHAREILELTTTDEFRFEEDGVTWRDYRLSTQELALIRQRLAISFGSCSFTEPVDDLRNLKLL